MNPIYPYQGLSPGIGGTSIGPIDHESFFTAQRRYRRQTWRLSFYCSIAVVLAGIPLSISLTPILFALALAISGMINLFTPLPQAVTQTFHDVAYTLFTTLSWLNDKQHYAPPSHAALIINGVSLILPGAVMLLFLWTLVLGVFERAGVGGILWTLGARLPRMNDFKERQLVNIVAEMALAAGISEPRLVLLDNGEANVAFIGTCEQDAVVVVSRKLLDECTREEAQGMLAHAVAAIGNGDLKIAFRVVAVKLTMALMHTLLDVPFNSRARSIMGRFFLLPFRRRSQVAFAAEAEQVMQMLLEHLDDSDTTPSEAKGCSQVFNGFMRFVLLPLVMANLAVMISTFVLDWLIIGPPISRMWRTRRFLADASAVQLTRNPNGLASALKRIRDRGGYIPGGGLASHLFVFWNASSSGKKSDVLIWSGVHPSIHRRLKRFQKLSSQVAVTQALRRKGSPLATSIGLLLVSPLLVLAIGLMVIVAVMLVFLVLLVLGLEMMFMTFFLAVVYALFFLLPPFLSHLSSTYHH